MRVALAGNPNSGKTTLFNTLTGSTAHVGNWPGVTVDRRSGIYKKAKDEKIEIIDLPGIYSLSPYSPEEIVSRNFLVDEKPECIINIIDLMNLERNLYLTTQLIELDIPIVLALNMTDELERDGGKIDVGAISRALNIPVVKISALKKRGIETLMDAVCEAGKKGRKGRNLLNDPKLVKAVEVLAGLCGEKGLVHPIFHAVKTLEGDKIEPRRLAP